MRTPLLDETLAQYPNLWKRQAIYGEMVSSEWVEANRAEDGRMIDALAFTEADLVAPWTPILILAFHEVEGQYLSVADPAHRARNIHYSPIITEAIALLKEQGLWTDCIRIERECYLTDFPGMESL